MTDDIYPLNEFARLSAEEKVTLIRTWLQQHTVRDIRKAWGLNNPAQYYTLLGKYGIKDEIVRPSKKFGTERDDERIYGREAAAGKEASPSPGQPAGGETFAYKLSGTYSTASAAARLEGLSVFLQKSGGRKVNITIEIEEAQG